MKKYIVFLFLILTVILTICPIFAAETERRDSTAPPISHGHNNAPITRLPAVSSQLVKKNLKEGHSAICETGSPV